MLNFWWVFWPTKAWQKLRSKESLVPGSTVDICLSIFQHGPAQNLKRSLATSQTCDVDIPSVITSWRSVCVLLSVCFWVSSEPQEGGPGCLGKIWWFHAHVDWFRPTFWCTRTAHKSWVLNAVACHLVFTTEKRQLLGWTWITVYIFLQ